VLEQEEVVPTVAQDRAEEVDPDVALMLEAQRGDRQAFEALFDRYSRAMVNFAYRYVGDRGRAEELAQDVFVKLHRSLPSYAPASKFRTYLYRIATNHFLNELRRGEYRSRPTPLDGDGEHPRELVDHSAVMPDEMAEARQTEAAIGRALGALSDRERLAISLCRLQGLSYREIAEVLETTESAVKSLIHRATVALAQQLEDAGEAAAVGVVA
jgi:RNA polymerase sigma-70 factor, ECF subfamily